MNSYARGVIQPSLPSKREVFTPSRLLALVQENVTRAAVAWDGDPAHVPSSPAVIHLSAADNQYSLVTVRDDYLILRLKTLTVEYVITFHAPRKYLKRYRKVNKPDVRIKKDGSLEWSFTLEVETPSPNLSFKYVIGVDRGITEAAVWSVIDQSTGEVVQSFTSSTLHHQLRARLERQEENKRGVIHAITRANPGLTPVELRSLPEWERVRALSRAITNSKREASILLAQEITATARYYDNCLIMMEDLHWSGNWRGEPYGELLSWTSHYAELTGLHVQLVNPAWSSTTCSICEVEYRPKSEHDRGGLFHGSRVFTCPSCHAEVDRDVNASIIIARRGMEQARKSAATRLARNQSKRARGERTPRQSRVTHSKRLNQLAYSLRITYHGRRWRLRIISHSPVITGYRVPC